MAKLLRLTSREYKFMLDQRLFDDYEQAAQEFLGDLQRAVQRMAGGTEIAGDFDATLRREIVFLDTPDQTIKLNRLLFRQRIKKDGKDEAEYTLKCRSPDRYFAAAADLTAADGLKGASKFEEDIGAPFLTRFSQSNTVKGDKRAPTTLGEAAEIFPALGKLRRDGRRCHHKIELEKVNSLQIFERVLKGPVLHFGKVEAQIALILWSDREEGRPLVAEFSFRYGDEKERHSRKVSLQSMEFFEKLQALDWGAAAGRTKTQFAYGES